MNSAFSTDEETDRGSWAKVAWIFLTIGTWVIVNGNWMIPGWALAAVFLASTRRGRARLRSFWSRSFRDRAGLLLASAVMLYLHFQGRGFELSFQVPWFGWHAVLWLV